MDLQVALGAVLTATKGWSAPEVAETLARARMLAEQTDLAEGDGFAQHRLQPWRAKAESGA